MGPRDGKNKVIGHEADAKQAHDRLREGTVRMSAELVQDLSGQAHGYVHCDEHYSRVGVARVSVENSLSLTSWWAIMCSGRRSTMAGAPGLGESERVDQGEAHALSITRALAPLTSSASIYRYYVSSILLRIDQPTFKSKY